MDETGFSPTAHRQYGWGKRGHRVYGLQHANQRPRTSLIGGYLNHQLIAPMLFKGTCNTEVFNQWLEHMLLPVLITGSVIVMDNAAFHKSDKTIELIEEVGCIPLFLSPYSPDLNPIEKLWGNIKRQWRYASHLNIEQFLSECNYLME